MNNEIEAYVGELRFLRERVKELEKELLKYRPKQSKVRVSGVPYEVDLNSQEPDRYIMKD
jgi:hypothetical protein